MAAAPYSKSTMQCAEALLDLAMSSSNGELETDTCELKYENSYHILLDHSYCFLIKHETTHHNTSEVDKIKQEGTALESDFDENVHAAAHILSTLMDGVEKKHRNSQYKNKQTRLLSKKTSYYKLKQKENRSKKSHSVGRPKLGVKNSKEKGVIARRKVSLHDPYEFTDSDEMQNLPNFSKSKYQKLVANSSQVGTGKRRGKQNKVQNHSSSNQDEKYRSFQILMSCLDAPNESNQILEESIDSDAIEYQQNVSFPDSQCNANSLTGVMQDDLELGQSVKDGPNQYQCHACYKSFMKKRQLEKHIRRRHPPEDDSSEASSNLLERNDKNSMMSCTRCGKFVYCSFFDQHLAVCDKNAMYIDNASPNNGSESSSTNKYLEVDINETLASNHLNGEVLSGVDHQTVEEFQFSLKVHNHHLQNPGNLISNDDSDDESDHLHIVEDFRTSTSNAVDGGSENMFENEIVTIDIQQVFTSDDSAKVDDDANKSATACIGTINLSTNSLDESAEISDDQISSCNNTANLDNTVSDESESFKAMYNDSIMLPCDQVSNDDSLQSPTRDSILLQSY